MKRHTPEELERMAVERGGVVRHAVCESSARRTEFGRHVLRLDGFLPPTLNAIMRGRIRDRCRIEKATDERIAIEAARQGIPKATIARRVTLEMTFPKGRCRFDPDACFKAVGDALKSCGLIVADTYEYVTWEPVVYFIGPMKTLIILEDIPIKVVEHA